MGRVKDYYVECAYELEAILKEMSTHELYSVLGEFYENRTEDYLDSWNAYDDDFDLFNLANVCLLEDDDLDNMTIENFLWAKGLRENDDEERRTTA